MPPDAVFFFAVAAGRVDPELVDWLIRVTAFKLY